MGQPLPQSLPVLSIQIDRKIRIQMKLVLLILALLGFAAACDVEPTIACATTASSCLVSAGTDRPAQCACYNTLKTCYQTHCADLFAQYWQTYESVFASLGCSSSASTTIAQWALMLGVPALLL